MPAAAARGGRAPPGRDGPRRRQRRRDREDRLRRLRPRAADGLRRQAEPPACLLRGTDAILFEASNPRHAHEWVVWQHARIPEDKILVPGLVTSTSNYLEHPELIAQRIAQFAGIGKMDAGIAWKKLAALVEGAALAARRLWGR